MPKLYVVATPIGNMEDITLRALRMLREADFIICEDTRVTGKLLAHYEIRKPLLSYHEHSSPKAYEKISGMLTDGRNAALVTDAGTPAISDPGARLISYLRDHVSDIEIIPIPGPSPLLAAASVSGINMDEFLFLGFPPHKKGRKTFFMELAEEVKKHPVAFYESPHRAQKAFKELEENLGEGAKIIVARELTKIHEETWRGTPAEAGKHFQGERLRGEFVIIIPRQ